MRFMAIAKVSCASAEIDPYDIAPVENLLMISLAGSTSSIEIGLFAPPLNSNKPRKVINLELCSLTRSVYLLKMS
ncbi:unannotated protein [freshwater metagenome]|uniref:Unannotated protein n=1 Tax=freshwater metagenome TaxID=449393 RepID=A0A6J6DNS0_9ZZZZ